MSDDPTVPSGSGRRHHPPTKFLTKQRPKATTIKIADPYPFLHPGEYEAVCVDAAFDWSNYFRTWKARMIFEPIDYRGRPYNGKLCKFFGLGKRPEAPYAGPRSDFRKLVVEVNGAQPVSRDVSPELFVGHVYQILVETVMTNGKKEPLSPEHQYSIVRRVKFLRAGPPSPSPPSPGTYGNPKNSDNHSNPKNLMNLGNRSTDQPSNHGNLPLGNAQRARALQQARNEFG